MLEVVEAVVLVLVVLVVLVELRPQVMELLRDLILALVPLLPCKEQQLSLIHI